MTRSVYVTGIDRGDGRQVVELGVMELLTRQVDRVGVFRPLVHDGPDRLFELLRARYRLSQDPATVYGIGLRGGGRPAGRAGHRRTGLPAGRPLPRGGPRGTRWYSSWARDFAGTQLPDELALNARLANEFGASVIPVVGGQGQSAESVRAEARNAYRAYEALGCDVVAMVANRVAPGDRAAIAERLAAQLPGALLRAARGARAGRPDRGPDRPRTRRQVLLGDDAGLARDALDFVFGGAMLPAFLPALTEGCLVVTPGDRADLVVGALAAHSAGTPPIAGRAADPGRAARPGRSWRSPPGWPRARRWSRCPAAHFPPRPSCSRWRAS